MYVMECIVCALTSILQAWLYIMLLLLTPHFQQLSQVVKSYASKCGIEAS